MIEYRKELVDFAIDWGKQEADAEDIVSDVFMAVLSDKSRSIEFPKTYLRTAVFNRCVATPSKMLQQTQLLGDNIDLLFEDQPESELERLANEREALTTRRKLYKAIRRLGSCYQETTFLKLKGLTGKQIADKLNVPEGTVKRRLHTVRKLLKEKLCK